MADVIEFRGRPGTDPRGTTVRTVVVDGKDYTVLRLISPETHRGFMTIRSDDGEVVVFVESEIVPDIAVPAVIRAYNDGATRERQRARIAAGAATYRAFTGHSS
jgi:hypothetical protein